jgi:hypothetical protein
MLKELCATYLEVGVAARLGPVEQERDLAQPSSPGHANQASSRRSKKGIEFIQL